jgi:hypothetical protein
VNVPSGSDRIALAGKAGAGKDHVLSFLTQFAAGQGRTIHISGFGDLVRSHWMELHGNRVPTRTDLQKLSAERRESDYNFWIKRAQDWARTFDLDRTVLGFTGVRYHNELDGLREVGFSVGLVLASDQDREHRLYHRDGRWWKQHELNHITERGLDEISLPEWDFVIQN